MKRLPFLFTVLLLTGCSTLQSQVIEVKPMVSDAYVDALLDGYTKNNGLASRQADYEKEPDVTRKKQIRDRVANELLLISDFLYHEFKTGLFNNRALKDTTVQILDLVLTGTASVTGTAHAKSNMAAFSTFLKGANATIDKNYYAEQTIASLINVMDGERADIKTEIITGLQADTNKFGFDAAVRLIAEYHQKGSVLNAIIVLSRDTGRKTEDQILKLNTKMQNLGLK